MKEVILTDPFPSVQIHSAISGTDLALSEIVLKLL